ncbi:restriction endonuclease-like protein [Clostridiaceae bacterium UIB06]|uniref:Restriction endonuclease-like protein n=1 Tax=Clostridium thailandense TaxID=2794346 RepID=A0A949WVJ5_9CLOT|nr:restriction endonuclease-like protein [Clostridium thailandense]MBV7273757.1 restriction endonuclease-like protein [Clostridium thailandense]MCH5137463.1 restriction endonuclease-like protein [Clostridiaceae bacterium UIB06]
MDLQPSGRGKEELLCLETDKIYFTIKGKNRNSEIKDEDTDSKGFKIAYEEEDINLIIDTEKAYFFEYEKYELIVEKKDKEIELGFYHENKDIRNKITKNRSGSLSGIVSFKGDIGLSDLVIKVNGREHIIITVEVFPTKIDYRKDYINLLNDVNKEIYNLAFDFLKRTYSIGGLIKSNGTTLSEYYNILSYIFEKLKRALNIIVAMPHHSLVNERQIAPYHKIKNVTNETIKWLEKKPEKLIKKGNKLLPVEALQINKRATVDTNENRFLKFIVKGILFKLKELRKRYLMLERGIDDLFVVQLESFIKDINRYLISTFLKDVGEYEFRENSSMVFKMALGYKDVYKYYLMLQKGLTLKGELFKLNIKDLPLLYEYWCFIKINEILRKNYTLISNDTVKVKNNGVFVALKKGKESRVVYENPVNGERFVLSYNLKMHSETVGQKPDNVLAIDKIGGEVTYNYIFDAKYKIDRPIEGSEYQKYKTPGPKEEDINTMHKYRDAIVCENKENGRFDRSILGAFVLFPYGDEEEYCEHPLYRSIEKVRIGGIPFLPSASRLMEEFLGEIIGESYLDSFEKVL